VSLSGWPTATTRDWKDGGNPDVNVPLNALLGRAVWLAGWTTPTTPSGGQTPPEGTTASGRTPDGRKVQVTLKDVAAIAGWPTPNVAFQDGDPEKHLERKRRAGVSENPVITDLSMMAQTVGPARLTVSGEMLTGSTAGMTSGGQLSPEHSRWLMGIPHEWVFCALTAMLSFPKKSRRSSKQQKKMI
jgi:hypothetical protein